ncbi:hypothetical protein [Lewinella sp. W8]|uniref:hypothetical protein n=1 Tax=Lewinella sp. W8 TaxID=2528208 RepID=UPI00106747D8|nr:hypothetical protein [Lewinella sp. W8]MTB51161.1 hypothetical protein [Lewinella sp. W8]
MRLLTLLPFVLFLGCQSANDIESSFSGVVDAAKQLDVDQVDSLINQDSKLFLDGLLQAIIHRDSLTAGELGYRYGLPVTTLVWYENLKDRFAEELHADSVSYRSLLPYLMLGGEGIFRLMGVEQPQVNKVSTISTDLAQVDVNIPTGSGNVYIVTSYQFSKEDGLWKLDYPSSLRMKEKILEQERRRHKMEHSEFARLIAKEGEGDLTFSYRKGIR